MFFASFTFFLVSCEDPSCADCAGGGVDEDGDGDCDVDCIDPPDDNTPGALAVQASFEGETVDMSVLDAETLEVLGYTGDIIAMEADDYAVKLGDPDGTITDDQFPTHLIEGGTWDGWTVIAAEVSGEIGPGKTEDADASLNAYASGTWTCQIGDGEDAGMQTGIVAYTDGHLIYFPSSSSDYVVSGMAIDFVNTECDTHGAFISATQVVIENDCGEGFQFTKYCWAGQEDEKPAVW